MAWQQPHRSELETLAQAVERARALPNAAESQRLATAYAIITDCSLPRPTRGSGEHGFAGARKL